MGIHTYTHLLWAASAFFILNGCTPKNPLPPGKYTTSSYLKVPFISPRSELCASTSIEMLASYWETKTPYVSRLSRQALDGRTLIPEKGGTLQVELVATARANGLLVYPLTPTFDALFAELAAQHPVIVLVNRGYSWYPLWHYAPVTGYDAQNQSVLMHFSDEPNEPLSIERFAALWERSGHWAVVLLPPMKLPASASPHLFLPSAYALEKTGRREDAISAYQSALKRWPKDTNFLFALANAYNASHQPIQAEKHYRKLLSFKPKHPLALNNLADLLCRTGRSKEALSIVKKAVTDDDNIKSIIKATLEEIRNGCTPLDKRS